MNQTAASLTRPEVILTVLSGKDSGVQYKLLGQAVKLGRAPENDVVIDDVKASRNHASIEWRQEGYWIKDLDSQHGVRVNGKPIKEMALQLGDKIVIGSTQFRFGTPSSPALTMAGRMPLPRSPDEVAPSTFVAQGLSQVRYAQKKSPFGMILVGAITLGIILMIFQKKASNRKTLMVKDNKALEEQIEKSAQTNEERQQQILKSGKSTQQYAEARAFYLRGFREYREGNYSRAIQFFETALSLFPEHPMAKRYLERSRLKRDELVTSALSRGERDFELQKYTMAFNEYRTVLLLLNDLKNPKAQLAQKRIEAINLILLNSK